MNRCNRHRLVKAFIDSGLLAEKQLESILSEAGESRKQLGRLLIERGLVTEDELLAVMEIEFKIPRVNLNHYKIDPAAPGLIPPEMAVRYRIIPLKTIGEQLTLAMVDPLDLAAIDDVAMITGFDVTPVTAREKAINYLIDRFYSLPQRPGQVLPVDDKSENLNRISENRDDAPIIKVVSSLIEKAIEEGASDIHLEPCENANLRIRLRLDGLLHDLIAPPGHTQANIISRVKIMAGLDIAEKRHPQDGNIAWGGDSSGVSLRVSTMPTIYGEKIVIRILDKEKIILSLEKLGFSKMNYRILLRLLQNQHGLLLVTGPTGCGKTTTLYSALHYLNRPADNIITVEDPVEYRLKGINQVQVNQRINRNFANALRSILRQDPDIIMVGEIRDGETAKITTQAALTGHFVLSTLHTNSAAGAVTRLLDMGLEDYLVTASLLGVIAQRLIRKICPHCREEYQLGEKDKRFFERFFNQDPPNRLSRGSKCRICNQTGYSGRSSIQEILVINPELQELILKGATVDRLQKTATSQGMRSLTQDGLRSVEAGLTTVDEIVRTTFNSIYDRQDYINIAPSADTAGLQGGQM